MFADGISALNMMLLSGAVLPLMRRKRGALVLGVVSSLNRLRQQELGGGVGTGIIAMRERAQAVNGQLRP